MFSSEEFEKCKEEYEKLVKDTDKFIDLLYDSKPGDLSYNFLAYVYEYTDFKPLIRDKLWVEEFKINLINSLKWLSDNGGDKNKIYTDINEIISHFQDYGDNHR